MSAWKYMDAKARRESVAKFAKDGFGLDEAAASLGAPMSAVHALWPYDTRNTDEGSREPPESPACDGPSTHAGEAEVDSSAVAGATSDGGGEAHAIATAPIEAARARPIPEGASPPPQIKRQKVTRPEKTAGEARTHFTSQKQAKTLAPVTVKAMAAAPRSPLKGRPKLLRRPQGGEKRFDREEQGPKRFRAIKKKGEAGAKAEALPPEPKVEPATDEIAITIHLPRRVLPVLQERAEKPRWTRAQMAAAMVIQACNKKV